MIRFGIVSDIDPEKGKARVHFNDDEMVSDWLPLVVSKAMEDSFSFMPDVNEHVACLMDEHSDKGVIIGSIYSKDVAPNGGNKDKVRMRFKDGTVIEYDRAGHKLFADVKGQVEIKATGNVRAETSANADVKAVQVTLDAPNVICTGILTTAQLVIASGAGGNGNLQVAGNVIAQGDVESVSGDVKAGAITMKTHKHLGVQTGGSQTGIATA